MTQKEIYEALVDLAKRGHQTGLTITATTREQPWTCADLVHQEALYTIQGDLLALIGAVARSLDGDKSNGPTQSHLCAAMPFAFHMAKPEPKQTKKGNRP